MHIRRHAHTSLDVLMFMMMSLRSEGWCKRCEIVCIYFVGEYPEYSTQRLLNAAFNWFQKQQACGVSHTDGAYRKTDHPLSILWRHKPWSPGIEVAERSRPVCLILSAGACNARFLHDVWAHALSFFSHLIKCHHDRLQSRPLSLPEG